MEMDSRSFVSKDITGALLLCSEGEFISEKHRKRRKNVFLCACVKISSQMDIYCLLRQEMAELPNRLVLDDSPFFARSLGNVVVADMPNK